MVHITVRREWQYGVAAGKSSVSAGRTPDTAPIIGRGPVLASDR